MEERLVSNCCGAVDRLSLSEVLYSEWGLCPSCREHCDFITELQREEEMKLEILTGKKDTNE